MIEKAEKNTWVIENNPPSYPKIVGYFKSKLEICLYGAHMGMDKAKLNAQIIKEALNIYISDGLIPSELYTKTKQQENEINDLKYKLITMQHEISELHKKPNIN